MFNLYFIHIRLGIGPPPLTESFFTELHLTNSHNVKFLQGRFLITPMPIINSPNFNKRNLCEEN